MLIYLNTRLMKKVWLASILILTFVCAVHAQNGIVKGRVVELVNNEPVPFATIIVEGTTIGTSTDLEGNYSLNVEPGIYAFRVSFLGFQDEVVSEIEVNSARPTTLNFKLKETELAIEEVVVKANAFKRVKESPVSLRTIGVSEIRRNPGANRDISRVVQSLPGVTSSVGFRNDLIIRGGAPNENRFYLDGVEVPNINHYATQGAGGGPAGLINVNFIREVDFYSGAFPANKGNALSAILSFKQRDGRDDRIGGSAVISGTDAGISLEGPIGNGTTFLLSARRSYLSFLFKQIGLPFLPTYNDFQVKTKTKINKHHEIVFVGLGAIDQFKLNLDAATDEGSQYILDYLPETPQWNYTNGIVYKNYFSKGVRQIVLSRNMLDNRSFKYKNNDKSSPDNLTLDYKSREIENKLRVEEERTLAGYKLSYGALYEYVKYSNSSALKVFIPNVGDKIVNYSSALDFHKYGAFGQIGKSFLQEKLDLSFGVRLDGNTYSDAMSNPLEQVSPRISISYKVIPRVRLNANTGLYYQLPAYTVLGFKEGDRFVNKENGIRYIQGTHAVAGIEYEAPSSTKVSLEGYYKTYTYYPFLINDSISLANLGGDFGVVGNAPVSPTSNGVTYGLEALIQQRLYKGFYGILAYTLGWSSFEDKRGVLTPSSWDSRHIISLTAGKRFSKNWEIGMAFRYQSGLPYTPFDEHSNLKVAWDINNGGFRNYDALNSLRSDASIGLDIRIDKKWFFKNWSLNVYIDVENVTAYAPGSEQLILDRPLDDKGLPIGGGIIENPGDPIFAQRYKVKTIKSGVGTPIPSLGVQVDF